MIATASTPRPFASGAGLTDRGDLAPGRRADLVRVWCADELAVVREVWRDGNRVC